MMFTPVVIDSATVAHLDVSDIPSLARNINIQPYLDFTIKTYLKLTRHSAASLNWGITFDPVNKFFDTLPVETKELVAITIITMHKMLMDTRPSWTKTNIVQTLDDVGTLLMKLNLETDLCSKIRAYAVANLPIGDFSKVGNRPQDRDEYTFRQNETEDLMAIVVLCKMLSPIFGVLMELLSVDDEMVSPGLKLTYTARILHPLFQSRYPELIQKLEAYINHNIITSHKTDMTMVFSSVTPSSMNARIFATILIKSLVNLDIYYRQGKGNVMTYIYATSRNAARTEVTTATNKGAFRPRKGSEPTDNADTGFLSQYEIDSTPSEGVLEIEAYIPAILPLCISRLIAHHDLDENVYNAMVEYYTTNRFAPNRLNRCIVTGFFGSAWFDGAGIALNTKYSEYIKMVCVCQLLAFSNEWPNLGHLLTARESAQTRELQNEEIDLRLNYSSGPEFGNCRNAFVTAGVHHWDSGIQAIITSFLNREWIHNTADVIWDLANTTNLNSTVIKINHCVAAEISSFMETFVL